MLLLLEEKKERWSWGFGFVTDRLGFLFEILSFLWLLGLYRLLFLMFLLYLFDVFQWLLWYRGLNFFLNDILFILFFRLLNSIFNLELFPAIDIHIKIFIFLLVKQVAVEIVYLFLLVLFLVPIFLFIPVLISFTSIFLIQWL